METFKNVTAVNVFYRYFCSFCMTTKIFNSENVLIYLVLNC